MAGVRVFQRSKTNPDGSVTKYGWSYRFEIAYINGERQRCEKGGFEKKSDAQRAGNAAFSEYNNTGLCFTPQEISVSDYLDLWIKEYAEVNLKTTTVAGYKKIIKNYIKPALGQYRLNSITSITVQKFINDIFNEGFSRNSLATIKGVLTGSFGYAVNTLQLIKISPAACVKLPMKRAEPKTKTRKHERVVVPESTIQDVLQRFPEGHPCHIPFQLGYRCGMRLGEVFGVSWDDIDFENKTLTINWQVQMDDEKKLWRLVMPKYDSTRKILLDDIMLELLKRSKVRQEQREQNYADLFSHLYLDETNHIITTQTNKPYKAINIREDGSYIAPRIMQHAFRVISGKDNPSAKKHLNAPLNYSFDFHSLRHTHATMLLSAGVSPVTVKDRLGHKNIETTLGIYAHVTESMNNQLLNTLNGIK